MGGIEINGLSVLDAIRLVRRRNGRYLAIILSELEDTTKEEGRFDNILEKHVEDEQLRATLRRELRKTQEAEFQRVRKTVLDGFNDYTRSILRSVLGIEIEDILFYRDV